MSDLLIDLIRITCSCIPDHRGKEPCTHLTDIEHLSFRKIALAGSCISFEVTFIEAFYDISVVCYRHIELMLIVLMLLNVDGKACAPEESQGLKDIRTRNIRIRDKV